MREIICACFSDSHFTAVARRIVVAVVGNFDIVVVVEVESRFACDPAVVEGSFAVERRTSWSVASVVAVAAAVVVGILVVALVGIVAEEGNQD